MIFANCISTCRWKRQESRNSALQGEWVSVFLFVEMCATNIVYILPCIWMTQSDGKELTKEEKQRLRKEKKQQKKNREKKDDATKPDASSVPPSQKGGQLFPPCLFHFSWVDFFCLLKYFFKAPSSVPAAGAEATATSDKAVKSKVELKVERRPRHDSDRSSKQGKKRESSQQQAASAAKPKVPPSELQPGNATLGK